MEKISQNFESVYKEYYSLLRNAANNIISDRDASHDVVQEVFLKLWDKKDSFHLILNQKAYLFKAVVNASISYLENKKKKVAVADLQIADSESSDAQQNAKELESKIQKALNKLPARCKAIFVLSRFEEMKQKDIANMLGLSLKTVENQMGIALKKMKEEMSSYISKEYFSVIMTGSISLLVGLKAFII